MPQPKKLRASLLKISNILGISKLEISLGKFTVVSGANGEGKSSVIESIKASFSGSHDATLLRDGAERGSAVLVLNDGTQIAKSVTAERSTHRVIDASGEKVERKAEYLRELADMTSVNPIEFLNAPKKHQISTLLEAMPMRADVVKLAEIAGHPVAPELANAHAIVAIESVHDSIFDNRTDTNREIAQKKGTIAQLEAAIPEELADVDAVNEADLEKALASADTARDAELARIDTKIAGMETTWETKISGMKDQITEINRQIAEVQEERHNVRERAEKQRRVTRELCTGERAPVSEKLAVIRANRDAAARARATRETIDTMRTDLTKLEEGAAAGTASLAALDVYKTSLLDNLPIPGLTVKEGEIFYGKVRFERLNTAGRMKVAAEVARLRAGPLGLVCVDGIEALDAESFDAFREAAMGGDVQFVVTRVGKGPLTVESES